MVIKSQTYSQLEIVFNNNTDCATFTINSNTLIINILKN
jgi:hypothetical protein